MTPGRTVDSIFIGGGTPSLMEPQTVAAVLDAIADCWPLGDDVEITLEANPSSVEAERFQGYRAAGVNRLSLGVQALNDQDLKFLGRLHVALEPRFLADGETLIYRLSLTARGAPLGKGFLGVVKFFNLGREYVVRGFASVTTEKMHEKWGRCDGKR